MLCKCDCGQEVTSGKATRPNLYVNREHRDADRSRIASLSRAAKDSTKSIPIESFAEALLTLKATKGLTWGQMAVMAGRTPSHLSALVIPGHKKTILKATAEDILRRINGEHLSPTPLQVRQYNARMQKLYREQRAETLKIKKTEDRHVKLTALSLRLGASSNESAQDEQAQCGL